MTDYLSDARPACMVAALDTLRAAQKLKLEPGSKTRAVEHLPELYWALVAEAAIYAELAKADAPTGIAAGSHMERRHDRIRENRRRAGDIVKRASERAEAKCSAPFASFTVGRRVRVIERQNFYHGRMGVIRAVDMSLIAGFWPALTVEFDPLPEEPDKRVRTFVSARDIELIGHDQ